MNSKTKIKKQQKKTTSLIILSLITVIVLMVVYMTYTLSTGKQTPFFARDISTASYDCEDKIDARFDENLVSRHFDEISSRYEVERKQYIIYYRVSTKQMEHGVPVIVDKLVKCTVWESIGYVSDFEIYNI